MIEGCNFGTNIYFQCIDSKEINISFPSSYRTRVIGLQYMLITLVLLMELENQLVNCLYKMNSLSMSAFGLHAFVVCLKWFSSSSCMIFFSKKILYSS